MPNVVLYGVTVPKAERLRRRLRQTLGNNNIAKEVVVTRIQSDVRDLNGKKAPFAELRHVPGADPELVKEVIISVLKGEGLDVERVILEDFESKED